MASLSLSTRIALCLGTFVVGCFFATMVIVFNVMTLIKKGPIAMFYKKKRPSPPACMQDPRLGVHGYAHLEDVRIHYVSSGPEDKPLMLLVHGFPEFWYSWRHQLREFNDEFRVVAIDQRGYGDSDKPSFVSSYTVPALTNDLKNLVLALGYKKCVLVGHDWGGIVAWSFALTCPEMVDRFIVMNCPSHAAFFRHISSFKQLKKSWYMALYQVPFIPELICHLSDLDFLRMVFKGKKAGVRANSVSDEDMEAYKYTFQRNGFTAPMNYYRALVRYPYLPSFNLNVQCPTLILWGCKDMFLDAAMASLSTESVSGEVTVKYLENCSHWVQMDQYEDVNAHMRQFLNRTSRKTK